MVIIWGGYQYGGSLKPIEGYEGFYEISNFGRVKSLERSWITGKNLKRHKGETILKHKIDRGYARVGLLKDGKRKIKCVHRLVGEHFLEE